MVRAWLHVVTRRRSKRFVGHEENRDPTESQPPGSWIGLGSDVVLGEREIQEPVPVGVYLLGHRLLLGAVFARNLGRLWVAGPLG